MKRLFIASLSTLVLVVAAPAHSQQMNAMNQNTNSNITAISPFNLVENAYQGYFSDQGISGHGAFLTAVNSEEITAYDLVKSAIAKGRLSPETLNDQNYIYAVQFQLKHLIDD